MGDGSAYGNVFTTPRRPDGGALKIAYLGHDSGDAAVRRRARTLLDDGFEVLGFMPHRRESNAADIFWDNVDLGRTVDGALGHRVHAILKGASIIATTPGFAEADLMIARNLDMLAVAFEAKRRAGLKTPVIFECLDIHRLVTRTNFIGKTMRAFERELVRRCARVWVSSPGFVTHHLERHYSGLFTADLLENRLPVACELPKRPARGSVRTDLPLHFGWVGRLRCQRSLDMMCALADRFGDRLHIHLHGIPSRSEISVFEPVIEARSNITYHGPYIAPDDLGAIYASLDAVWAGDFMEAGANSVWLLPNRIYEGGYFAVPPIAPAGTQTAAWIEDRQTGLTLAEPLEATLPALIERLIKDRTPLQAARDHLLEAPRETFVEPEGTLARLIALALAPQVRA